MHVFNKRVFSHFDYVSFFLIIPIIFLSYHLISNTNVALANRQLVYFAVAFVLFIFVLFIPIRRYFNIIPYFYWIGIFLLILVKLVGVTKLGATRWLEIPLTSLTFQPSELFKPIFILMIGYLIYNNPPPREGYGVGGFFYISFYILLPFSLIVIEPDLGTSLVLLIVGFGILFIIGVKMKIWITILLLFAFATPSIYTYLIKDYQKKRIEDFLSKKPSYHVKQSIIAIGSGGWTGQDEENATQTKLKFLPIATSDFIFAYLVERYGFVGGTIVLLLYMFLILHLLFLNNFFIHDMLLRTFAVGVGLLIFVNMSVNILMVVGLAPVVGLPLPMFSYGGSSFINYVILFAVLQNLIAFRFQDGYG
ncbi:MAG: rod shape-determining protein RodA [Campylobacteraceae bacterium 4484_166]|nr:MAG: rod shape-determining protein RodA [Campylobacteraceae bacterium 4484_166]